MAAHRQQRRSSPVSAWRCALLLLALVAASTQQLVAQTHWHAAAVQVAAAAGSPAPAAPGRHDDCLLCQIAAHAGAAAPPADLRLEQVASEAHLVRVPAVWHLVSVSRPAHAWQSRGPPAV